MGKTKRDAIRSQQVPFGSQPRNTPLTLSCDLRVRVEGQLTYNTTAQMLNAALAGLGLAYVPEGMAQLYIAKGRLKRVLGDWCVPYSGYHLWYPSRRQSSAAFALLVDALRYRGSK
jgi:DNA-binding transcriptional LysR family regulator